MSIEKIKKCANNTRLSLKCDKMLLNRECDIMRKAFTLVEMITVLVVLSIIILIITPVMRDLMLDFEEKSNKQVYEQLYKAADLYYAEERANRINPLNVNGFWVTNKTYNSFIGSTNLKEKTWKEDTELPDSYLWACLNTNVLNERGYLKSQTLKEVKTRLEVNPEDLAIIMISEKYLEDNRIVIKEKALWIGNCTGYNL